MLERDIASPLHVRIRAVAHPAMRRTAEWLALVLAGSDIGCSFEPDVTAPQAERLHTIYLRPAATDALALAMSADLAGTPRLRDAGALIRAVEAQARDVYCILWESILAKPHAALRAVADHLQVSLTADTSRLIDARIDTLRRDAAPYDHPLRFLAALDVAPAEAAWLDHGLGSGFGAQAVSHWIDAAVPRSALVVTRSSTATIDLPIASPAQWDIRYMYIDGDAPLAEVGVTPRYGLIYFHQIEAAAALDRLLDHVMPGLADGGLLCGSEASEPAVAQTLAALTTLGDPHHLTVTLSGTGWIAIPPAWCR